MPFYLELEKGLKTEQVGLLLMIHSLVMVGLGPVAGKLSDRRDPRIICTFAMTLGAATCLEFFCTLELQSLFWVLLYLVSMSASLALFISPSNNLAMGLAPKGKHAIAAGVYGTVTRLGLMLGVSFFEVIFSGFTRAGPSAGEKLSALTASPAALVRGFRYAYLFGAFLCILTACCCLLGRREMRKENALEPAAMG
jgi:MFS family permease